MRQAERRRFDELLEQVLESLPRRIVRLLDEAPLIVEDRPSRALLDDLGLDADEIICGLHSGTPITGQTVEQSDAWPETIHLFREGIIEHAGGWEPCAEDDGTSRGGAGAVLREIRVTLLHEIGHHFGLEEEDLEALGYE